MAPAPLLLGQDLMPELDPGRGRYRVRFARTEEDLERVCRLRFEVFNQELDEGLAESWTTGLDRDHFDEFCQHLMVVDGRTEECVGTYRLQIAEMAQAGAGFYADTEFDLSSLPPERRAGLVELGRACVAQRHRSRKVLHLLWRGLLVYLSGNGRGSFVGCSSLTSQDPALGLATYRFLEQAGHLHDSLRVAPRAAYACVPADSATPPATPVKIPALFDMYLRHGARVLGPPALDRAFGTIDFLTWLDVDSLDPGLLRQVMRA